VIAHRALCVEREIALNLTTRLHSTDSPANRVAKLVEKMDSHLMRLTAPINPFPAEQITRSVVTSVDLWLLLLKKSASVSTSEKYAPEIEIPALYAEG